MPPGDKGKEPLFDISESVIGDSGKQQQRKIAPVSIVLQHIFPVLSLDFSSLSI